LKLAGKKDFGLRSGGTGCQVKREDLSSKTGVPGCGHEGNKKL